MRQRSLVFAAATRANRRSRDGEPRVSRGISSLLSAASFLFVPCAAVPGAARAAADASRPNVLLILADDLGFSDLGAYGGEIRTPNLDRLAAEGARHTQFYNAAVCWNTRSCLLSGLFPRPGGRGRLAPNMNTLGEVMKQAGYFTALVGKWHVDGGQTNHPKLRGFEEFYGFLGGGLHYFRPSRRTWDAPDKVTFGPNGSQRKLADFPPGYYLTDDLSARAAAMIRQAAQSQRPFFVHLCYTAPHTPLHAPPEDIARYRGRYREGYERLRERRFQRQLELGLFDARNTTLSQRDPRTKAFKHDYYAQPWDELTPAQRRREEEKMEVYAAMVDRLDQGVGRVLAALEETGQAGNTLVLFMSDNGGAPEPTNLLIEEVADRGPPIGPGESNEKLGAGFGWALNSPFRRYKAWIYEGGICTPMIARWPGVVRPGTLVTELSHVVDLMPTLIELAGGNYPATRQGIPVPPMEGRSFLPVLRGRPAPPRPEPLFWEFWGGRVLRDVSWKLVWGPGEQRWTLYDLATDRTETKDLAARHPERVQKMVAQWEAKARVIAPKGFEIAPP